MSDLTRVTKMAQMLLERQAEQAAAEAALEAIKKKVVQIEQEDLPTLMAELGLQEFKLSSGEKITIKDEVACSISKEHQSAAFAWLIKNKFGGIIKTLVAVQFGKGEHADAARMAKALQTQLGKAHPVELDESVHPQTLKAFVKERLQNGDALPVDLFGVLPFKKAIITKP
jgi:hypothetical protein